MATRNICSLLFCVTIVQFRRFDPSISLVEVPRLFLFPIKPDIPFNKNSHSLSASGARFLVAEATTSRITAQIPLSPAFRFLFAQLYPKFLQENILSSFIRASGPVALGGEDDISWERRYTNQNDKFTVASTMYSTRNPAKGSERLIDNSSPSAKVTVGISAQALVSVECFPLDLPPRPATATRNHSLFNRLKQRINRHVDLAAVLHLFDFRPWFWPITPRKYFVLFLVACAITGIIVSNYYFHWIDQSMKITRSYMLPVLIISVCAEPLIILIILLVGRLPKLPQHEIDLIMGKEPDMEAPIQEKFQYNKGPYETALVIPCHDTDKHAIKTTLESAFPHFRPQDIFIVDNGRTKRPSHSTCNFRQYISSLHPDIVYIWSPIGSKNAAQLVGALAAKNYNYIMTVDDDVCIPKNFRAPVNMIDEKFKAVAYPLKAMDENCQVPLWLVAWQDVEYRLSGYAKVAEDTLCGVQFPHGAGWFVERQSFIKLLEFYHPMDFIAEDCNAGLGMNRMGKGIRFDASSYLATEVPKTFFGPGLNWWKQRQKSWEMGRHGRLFAFIRQLLFSLPPKKTLWGIVWHKFTYFYLICTICVDWLRIPTIVALGRTATWWRNAILLMLFSAVPALAYKYIICRRRPDMAPRFWACLTYPFYKQVYLIVSIFGAIRCIGYYWGGHQRPPTIQQMIKNKDERCFWLDPRFEQNPGILADESKGQQYRTDGSEMAEANVQAVRAAFQAPGLQQPGAVYHSPLLTVSGVSSPAESPLPSPGFAPSRPSSVSPALSHRQRLESWSSEFLLGESPYRSMHPTMLPSSPAESGGVTLVGTPWSDTTSRRLRGPVATDGAESSLELDPFDDSYAALLTSSDAGMIDRTPYGAIL